MYNNPNNPFQNKTLEMVLQFLVDTYGWEKIAEMIPINCFAFDPSMKSSLTFLRRTPWARKKVEDLYVETIVLERQSGREEDVDRSEGEE